MPNENLKMLLPYGDTTGDGFVQFSFTLPVKPGPKAREAASLMIQKWGFFDVKIAHLSEVGIGYSFIVAFGRTKEVIDYTQIKVPQLSVGERTYKEIDALILKNIKRPIRIVGANTGFDAHTVGLDAILNMKGFDGDIGLERYKGFSVWNLGSQVPPSELVKRAIKEKADAILVSKIVTQKDIHLTDMRDILVELKKKGMEDRFILCVGGPRITHKMAIELGFDAGFTIGTRPTDVANFLYEQMLSKIKKK